MGKPFTDWYSCVQNLCALEIRGLLNLIASQFALKLLIAAVQVLYLLLRSEVTLHKNNRSSCDFLSFFSSQLSFLPFSQHGMVSELCKCLRLSLLLAGHEPCTCVVSSYQPVLPCALGDNPYFCLWMLLFLGRQVITDLICYCNRCIAVPTTAAFSLQKKLW